MPLPTPWALVRLWLWPSQELWSVVKAPEGPLLYIRLLTHFARNQISEVDDTRHETGLACKTTSANPPAQAKEISLQQSTQTKEESSQTPSTKQPPKSALPPKTAEKALQPAVKPPQPAEKPSKPASVNEELAQSPDPTPTNPPRTADKLQPTATDYQPAENDLQATPPPAVDHITPLQQQLVQLQSTVNQVTKKSHTTEQRVENLEQIIRGQVAELKAALERERGERSQEASLILQIGQLQSQLADRVGRVETDLGRIHNALSFSMSRLVQDLTPGVDVAADGGLPATLATLCVDVGTLLQQYLGDLLVPSRRSDLEGVATLAILCIGATQKCLLGFNVISTR